MAFEFDGNDQRYRELFDTLEGEEVGITYRAEGGPEETVDAVIGRTTRGSFELLVPRAGSGKRPSDSFDAEVVEYDDVIRLYVYAD